MRLGFARIILRMARAIDLEGKPICITGASAGIGRATALACARAGMPVLLAARREERLREIAETIRAGGGSAEIAVVDVTDASVCEAMIRRARSSFGSLYAVFANAGFGVESAMHEMSDADLRDIFAVNFFGSMNTVRPALPILLEQRAGHILFCSSCLAVMPTPFYGAYSATKACQHHVGRAMRIELAPLGVHVSTVHPIGVKTEFFQVAAARSQRATMLDSAPARLMQSPERVASAIVRCLRHPKPEVWTSQPARLVLKSAALTPRVLDVFLRCMIRARAERVKKKDRPRDAEPV